MPFNFSPKNILVEAWAIAKAERLGIGPHKEKW